MIELESFEPDIKELTDNIYIGPQAEILELIRSFNQRYTLFYGLKEIGVTNKFYWKPGTYPAVKELIVKMLQIDKKSNGISNLLYRMENRNWNVSGLKREITLIEDKLLERRRNNMVFQNNIEEIKESWELIRHQLLKELEHDEFNNEVTVHMVSEHSDYFIMIDVQLENYSIQYQDHGVDIALIEFPAKTIIRFRIKFRFISLFLIITLLCIMFRWFGFLWLFMSTIT